MIQPRYLPWTWAIGRARASTSIEGQPRTYVGHACTCCSVAATCMHKIRTLEGLMATCLAPKLLHSQPFFGVLQSVSGLESVTVRRSEHVRHEEDLKGHLVLFLPDCSFVSGDYTFLTSQTVCSYTKMKQPESYRGISFSYQIDLRCR
jgi:hypothetical protein